MSKPKTNSFAAKLSAKAAPPVGEGGGEQSPSAVSTREVKPKAPQKPSRTNVKHIGGYFDPAVSKQLRIIAVEEDTTVQGLLEEALDLLFHSKRKPTIASKPKA